MRFICLLAVACAACGGRSELVSFEDALAPDASPEPPHPADAGCTWGFAPLVSYPAGPAPTTIAIADLDGDGHADLAVNNYGGEPGGLTLNTLRNLGDGTFATWRSYPSTVSFAMIAGPFLSDTKADLVVGCDLRPNEGNGVFGNALAYESPGLCGAQDSYNNLVRADFDGDGRLDFGWALLNIGVIVYLNRGGGSFDNVETAISPVTPYMDTIASADFDQDGRPDLAGVSWGYGYPNYLRLFHNTGDGSFVETDIAQGSHIPKVIAAGDLNNDSWPDLVIDDASSGMEVLLNLGNGTFGPPSTYAFGDEVRSIAIGDLNADGLNDVVFGGYGTGMLGVFLNLGGDTFAPAVGFQVTDNPWGMALGDLNGDEHLDVATAVTGASGNNAVNVFLSQCQ